MQNNSIIPSFSSFPSILKLSYHPMQIPSEPYQASFPQQPTIQNLSIPTQCNQDNLKIKQQPLDAFRGSLANKQHVSQEDLYAPHKKLISGDFNHQNAVQVSKNEKFSFPGAIDEKYLSMYYRSYIPSQAWPVNGLMSEGGGQQAGLVCPDTNKANMRLSPQSAEQSQNLLAELYAARGADEAKRGLKREETTSNPTPNRDSYSQDSNQNEDISYAGEDSYDKSRMKKGRVNRKRIKEKFVKKREQLDSNEDQEFIDTLEDHIHEILECEQEIDLDATKLKELMKRSKRDMEVAIAKVKKNRSYYVKILGLKEVSRLGGK